MATPRTDSTGKIVPRGNGNGNGAEHSLVALVTKMGPELAKALPRHVTPDRMARIVLTALRINPALTRCTPASFLGSVMSAAQLGLELNTPLGHAYLIPYKEECTLIIGYQGMMDLCRRSGMVKSITAEDVREGDTFSYRLGIDPTIEHIPSGDPERESRPVTHVYAVAKMSDGERAFKVLTKAQVDAHRKRSRAANAGPWVTDYVEMGKKTVIRVLCKYLPKSAEVARAIALEETEERGGSQATVWDASVTDALASQGVEHDAETGEVQESDPETAS